MKKMILAVAVLFSVAMVSCGGEKKAADSETVAAESVVAEEVVGLMPQATLLRQMSLPLHLCPTTHR